VKEFLVTGGAGFVGSHLCERLVAEGHRVRALDDLSTGRAENLASLSGEGRFELVHGSATDEATVAPLVRGADAVLHLAAAVGVRLVHERPAETMENNVEAARVVLGASARRRVPVLFASSSEVYGLGAEVPFREDADLLLGATEKPRWSYACSKAWGEWWLLAHARGTLPACVVRFFNVVGPRQRGRYGMVLPRLVRQAVRGEPLTVYGDGRQTRAFLHVSDAVEACLRLVERIPCEAGAARVFNVGNPRETAIGALARLVRRVAGSAAPIVHMPYREAYGTGFEDPRRRVPDIERLARRTGFRPRVPLVEIVREAVGEARASADASRSLRATHSR